MEKKRIESAGNRIYKEAVKCVDSREARKKGLFMVEGLRSIREFLSSAGFEMDSLWVADSFETGTLLTDDAKLSVTALAGATVYEVPDELFKRLSDTETPQGVTAFVRRKKVTLEDALNPARAAGRSPLLVVLENLRDPGNLGTILRSADAFGATAVVALKGCCDVYSPKVVRSSMGSLFHVPVVTDIEDAAALAPILKEAGITSCAALLTGTKSPAECDFTAPLALWIGNEANGLTAEAAALADLPILIPMTGQAESLNAAIAASVLLYECQRQRLKT